MENKDIALARGNLCKRRESAEERSSPWRDRSLMTCRIDEDSPKLQSQVEPKFRAGASSERVRAVAPRIPLEDMAYIYSSLCRDIDADLMPAAACVAQTKSGKETCKGGRRSSMAKGKRDQSAALMASSKEHI